MYNELMEIYNEFGDGDFGIRITKTEDDYEVLAYCDGMELLPSFGVTKDKIGEVVRFITEVLLA